MIERNISNIKRIQMSLFAFEHGIGITYVNPNCFNKSDCSISRYVSLKYAYYVHRGFEDVW